MTAEIFAAKLEAAQMGCIAFEVDAFRKGGGDCGGGGGGGGGDERPPFSWNQGARPQLPRVAHVAVLVLLSDL